MKSAIVTRTSVFAAVLFLTLLTGCKASSPALTGTPRTAPIQFAPPKPDPKPFPDEFKFQNSEFSATQARYDENQISVNFQVTKGDKSVNDLKERDFQVKENGTTVSPFKIGSTGQPIDQVADIVFVVDITNSMSDFLESAKTRLKDFILSSKNNIDPKKNRHIRMCLVKFGDKIVEKCDQFYDNTNDADVDWFISKLTDLSVHKGQGEVDGHLDLPENAMGALVAATNAPWGPKSQRFAILVTDADFYSPDKPSPKAGMQAFHQANPETASPTMAEVHAALQTSGLVVFPVTKKQFSGYNSPLAGQPGIAQASGGQWFDFEQWKSGTLHAVLDEIEQRINTTYTLTYVVDQVQGLDPSLPNDKRQVQISTPNGDVMAKPPTSSMPTGRPQYQQVWKVADSPVQAGSMQVFVDDRLISANEYTVNGAEVQFKSVPKPGAKLRFVYLYEAIEKNLQKQLMHVDAAIDARTTKVFLNGKEARSEDIRFDRTGEGGTNVALNPSVMASNDPYGIRAAKGVKIRVVTNYSL